jgi:ABC-type amino acid transport substrate-binding protein
LVILFSLTIGIKPTSFGISTPGSLLQRPLSSTAATAAANAAIQHVEHELSQTRRGLDRLGDQIASLSGEVAGLSTDVRLIAALLRRAGFDDGSAIASLSASVIDSSDGGSSNVQQRATTGAGADGGNGSRTVRTPTRLDPQDVSRLSPPPMLLHGSAKAAAVAAAESSSHPHGATGSAKHAPRVGILEAKPRIFGFSVDVADEIDAARKR